MTIALSDATAHAVIVTGTQGRNLSAPAGLLAGSGWDLQGQYGDYLGTPVADYWFVTAAHIGGAGSTITLPDGTHHLTGAAQPIPGTDLVMRQVTEKFTSVAPIFNPAVDTPLTTADSLVVFGRGTARGAALGSNGWAWGTADRLKSWGTNTFEGLAYDSDGNAYLTADFDNAGDPNQGTLSVGDSGGGVFVQRNGTWKLVAINYGVELFRDSPTGGDYPAAFYDARGYYQQNETGDWVYLNPATTPNAVAQTWYSSYLPDAMGKFTANPIPEPGMMGIVAIGAMVLGRRARGRQGH